ncbi:unnamed protein product [Arctia plantaginis]|uniref:Uncharacterized protein n=1 Tax=Arctia plantaginis TaxID=874455 RepID=A0A8S0YZ28_ARCPL|nr:unnamed protein product [Arctia plantaginis]
MLTTQSGSSGTTSQNDKGPAGCSGARGGRRRDSCARVAHPAPQAIPSQNAARCTLKNDEVFIHVSGGACPYRSDEPSKDASRARRRSGRRHPLSGRPVWLGGDWGYIRLSAILHQSRPIQAGPAIEDRYTGTQHPRRAVPLPGRSVVHCGGHA